MSASVKWVTSRDKEEPALIIECQKFANAIVMDFPIYVITLSKQEADKLRPVEHRGEPYPVDRIVELYLSDAKFHGITDGALRIIRSHQKGIHPILDCKPSENDYGRTAGSSRITGGSAESTRIPRIDPMPDGAGIGPNGYFNGRTKSKPTVKPDAIPKRTARASVRGAARVAGTRGNVPQQLAEELGIDAGEVRKRLRKAGLSAPYDDIDKCRSALKG